MKQPETLRHCLVLAVLFLVMAPNIALAERPPLEVVSEFCRLDFEGSRLSSEGYGKIADLVAYPDEPGWDRAICVMAYEVGNARVEGDWAEVAVHYRISGFKGEKAAETRTIERETFQLERRPQGWKIVKTPNYPRISGDLLCR